MASQEKKYTTKKKFEYLHRSCSPLSVLLPSSSVSISSSECDDDSASVSVMACLSISLYHRPMRARLLAAAGSMHRARHSSRIIRFKQQQLALQIRFVTL